MAGHSKWAQIKHKKAATDAKKGKLFSKLSKEITVAAKIGGAGLGTNTRLRAAVERAKTEGMPKDNIDRAIQKTTSNSEDVNLQEFIYEALGPGGCAMIIEGITDNKNRSLNEIKLFLADNESKLANQGSLLWNFEKIGSLEIDLSDNTSKTPEILEEDIIKSGATDYQNMKNLWVVEALFTETDKIRGNLEKMGYKIKKTGHDYKPKTYLETDEKTTTKIYKILDGLSELDDVQEVYSNLK